MKLLKFKLFGMQEACQSKAQLKDKPADQLKDKPADQYRNYHKNN